MRSFRLLLVYFFAVAFASEKSKLFMTYVELAHGSVILPANSYRFSSCLMKLTEPTEWQKCSESGQKCDRTVFRRCCDGLFCVLKGFADGTCEKCLPQGHFCISDAECCSGDCAWYRFCK
ncbi:hypothetical protein ACTXT7_012606 [Hymenolepis weldensis]